MSGYFFRNRESFLPGDREAFHAGDRET